MSFAYKVVLRVMQRQGYLLTEQKAEFSFTHCFVVNLTSVQQIEPLR